MTTRDRVRGSGIAGVALIALMLGYPLARGVAAQILTEAHGSASSSYKLNHDGTVTDATTGLTWQHVIEANVYKQQAAFAHCAGLSLAGGGWRLPLMRELETIAGKDLTLASADYFWSSATDVGVAGSAGLAYFVGSSGYFDPSTALRVRCVR